ncbi:hypothetical protein COP1_011238 [Malus domestica]
MKEARASHLRLNSCFLMSQETTLYVTLEPCPMCAGAILQARVDTVVWRAPNKLLGADGSWIRLFPDGGEGNSSKLGTLGKTSSSCPPIPPKYDNPTWRVGIGLCRYNAAILPVEEKEEGKASRPGSAPASSSNFSPSIKVTYEDASHLPHNVLFVRVQRLLV